MKGKRAVSFRAEQKHTKISHKKEPLLLSENDSKSGFSVEILTNFNFNVYFLAAFSTSAVPLYGDEVETTASASN
jgi:hypothetical protein